MSSKRNPDGSARFARGKGEHTLARGTPSRRRVRATPPGRPRRAAGLPPSGAACWLQSGMTVSGAPFTAARKPPRSSGAGSPCAWPRVEGQLAGPPARRRRRLVRSRPARPGCDEQGDLHRISETCRVPAPSGASSALLQSAATRRAGPSRRASAASSGFPSRRKAPCGPRPGSKRTGSSPGSPSSATTMRFSVSVPVLSARITLVDPSVSTAESRSTTALRRLICHMPRASATVATIGRPSGTAATASARAISMER